MTEAHYHIAFEAARERSRQISEKGWTAEHDDQHMNGEMATAAACYTAVAATQDDYMVSSTKPGTQWPWNAVWWKPRNRRRALVKALALIIAEIERLDRASGHTYTQ